MAEWTGSAPVSAEADEKLLVLPLELEPAVSAFVLASTQWRWAPAGRTVAVRGMPVVEIEARRIGLDYGGLRAALAFADRRISPEDFDAVRLMEAEALRRLSLQ